MRLTHSYILFQKLKDFTKVFHWHGERHDVQSELPDYITKDVAGLKASDLLGLCDAEGAWKVITTAMDKLP